MPVLSIFRRLASWVMGGSFVSVSVSVSAVSSCTCVDRWACFARDSASCFRLPPRLWPSVCRVVVIKRVILGCDVTLCLYLSEPDLVSARACFFSCPRCHCLVIASQCLAVCLSWSTLHCCCLSVGHLKVLSILLYYDPIASVPVPTLPIPMHPPSIPSSLVAARTGSSE